MPGRLIFVREARIAKILIAASGLYGGLLAYVALARRLRDAGHELVIAGPKKSRAEVEGAGFRLLVQPEPQLGVTTNRVPPRPGRFRLRTPGLRRRRIAEGLGTLGVEAFQAALDAAGPDLALIDAELHPQIMATVARGQKLALLSPMFPSLPGPEAPPLHTAIVPGQGVSGSASAIRLRWARYRIWQRGHLLRQRWRLWGGDYVSLLEAMADRLGFDRRLIDRSRWQIPWGYHLPYLILQAAELDLPAPVPRHIRYVGPMDTRATDQDAAAALDLFRDAKQNTGLKLIYAGFGSILEPDPKLTQALFDAVARHPEWRLLLVARGGAVPGAGPPPDNATVVDWAPQADALAAAAVAITHGGINTVVECIAGETPSIVLTDRGLDGPGNAARLVYHGLGIIGQPEDDATTLERRIEACLRDDAMRAALGRMRAIHAGYAARGEAEAAVATLLEGTDS